MQLLRLRPAFAILDINCLSDVLSCEQENTFWSKKRNTHTPPHLGSKQEISRLAAVTLGRFEQSKSAARPHLGTAPKPASHTGGPPHTPLQHDRSLSPLTTGWPRPRLPSSVREWPPSCHGSWEDWDRPGKQVSTSGREVDVGNGPHGGACTPE